MHLLSYYIVQQYDCALLSQISTYLYTASVFDLLQPAITTPTFNYTLVLLGTLHCTYIDVSYSISNRILTMF